MKFEKYKVFTALDADDLKVGSKVIVADSMYALQKSVEETNETYENFVVKLVAVNDCSCPKRFKTSEPFLDWNLAYLIEEPKEKVLKWTDLKIGDVIRHKKELVQRLVIAIDRRINEECHILAGDLWCDDERLIDWEVVKE